MAGAEPGDRDTQIWALSGPAASAGLHIGPHWLQLFPPRGQPLTAPPSADDTQGTLPQVPAGACRRLLGSGRAGLPAGSFVCSIGVSSREVWPLG